MRKVFLLVACAALTFLGIAHYVKNSSDIKHQEPSEESEESEEQDGILLAQQQDFENTKDITLGYIPKYRLIEASENLAKDRRAMRTNASLRTSALTWTERGPNTDLPGPSGNSRGPGNNAATSGRMRAIWIDLADATNKTVWTGGIDGGVWKTTDITASPAIWTPITDFLGNLAVASICQDPSNTNIMYFGTGEKTYNIDAVRGGGVWKSTDHGATWNLLPNTTSFFNVSRVVCDGAGNIYVATIGSAGIRRSTDGGASWTVITPVGLVSNVTEMKLSSTGRMHIVCGYYNSGVSGYRYTDNPATVTTATWTSPAVSFTPVNFNVELATSGNTLYALPANASYETPVVWKSIDGGANWAATPTSPPATGLNSNTDLSSGQGWYNLAIGVDPIDPNNVVVGGLNTYRTSNGGTTWTQVARWVGTTLTYIHADQHFVTWAGNEVLMGTDGGIFYSANGGVNWSDRNTGLRLKQFYSCAIHPTTANYIIAGAQDNGMHVLTSPGLGSSVEFYGGDGAFGHIDQDQPQYQFGSYVFNVYRRSTNGGASWTSVTYSTTAGKFINPSDYDNYNNKMYAADVAGKYVRWENPQTGSTFTSVAVGAFGGSAVSHVMVSPYAGNRVYFGTDAGRVVKVDNADVNSPTATNITGSTMNTSTVSCVAVGTTDSNLMATFSNYGAAHVWVSTTGGGASGWTNISGNLPDIPVRWAMFYPYDDTKAIIATEAGVFETDNINGASTVWTQSTSFPIVRTDMLQYRPGDGTIVAATHGRGIWSAVIPVTATYVQFSATALSRPESTTATVASGCTGYTDYTVYLTTNRAPVGTATATINVSGGTAVQGVDYDFTTNGNFASPSNTITLANGATAPQPVTIRIYDNPNVEAAGSRSFTLSYTLSGTSDVVVAPSSQTFTFTINNDDLAPVPGANGNYTIGTYTVNSNATSAFQSSKQSHRLQAMYRASELTALGATAGVINSLTLRVVTKNSTKPFTGFTVSLAQTSATDFASGYVSATFTQVYTGDYTSVAGNNAFAFGTGTGSSSTFTWDGASNIVVQYCFDNAPAAADALNDLMEGDNPVAGVSSSAYSNAAGAGGCSLPVAAISVSRVNAVFNLATTGTPVETVLNASKTLTQAGNYDVYYYNAGKIMARIQNSSAFNYGCTQVTIDRAGSGATAFWSASTPTFLATKTYRVVPTTNNTSGSYQITLYYTAAEKAAWEAATGMNWNAIKMVKVKSQISNYTPATPAPDGPNAVDIVTPVLGMYGSDYTVTGTFTNGFSGFGVGVPGSLPLPVTLIDFTGRLDNNAVLLNWSTSWEQNAKNFDVEKSTDGLNFYRIGTVAAAGNSSTRKDYSLRDLQLSSTNYYRLKMNDLDGRNKLSPVVLVRVNNATQNVWVVTNPFSDFIDLRLAKEAAQVTLQLIGASGAVMAQKTTTAGSPVHWQLNTQLPAGSYLLRTTVDGRVFTNKLIKQ